MDNFEHILQMVFLTDANEKWTYSVSGVKPDLDDDNVSAIMDIILANDIFECKKGYLKSKYSAKITQRQVTNLDVK